MASHPDKPPYQIPMMAEVAAMRGTNGLTAVSTFSGCGGSCLGLEMAGWDLRMASEFVPSARETYALNHEGVPIDPRDIRLVTAQDILDVAGLEPGELDLFEGSPPCASFSTAGKREKAWGTVKKYSDVEQRADDLFFEWARLLKGLKPRAFVAENVSGLVKGTAKGYFKLIMERLRSCGYRVACRVLDAQWLGVPQARQRVIFVGFREDLGIDPLLAYPTPLPYRYSIRDAMAGLPGWGPATRLLRDRRGGTFTPGGVLHTSDEHWELDPDRPSATILQSEASLSVIHDTSGLWSKGDVTDEPSPTITVGVNAMNSGHFKVVGIHARDAYEGGADKEWDTDQPAPTVMGAGIGGVGTHQAKVIFEGDMAGTAVGEEWAKLRIGQASEKYFQLVRPDEDLPSPTITAAGGERGLASVTHPHEARKFTIAELRRICGFPDDFQLAGHYRQQWERLGRAVPPPMMRAVAEGIARLLLETR